MPTKTKQSAGTTLVNWAKRHKIFQQDANLYGRAICSGCEEFEYVVYNNMLQWCKSCWVLLSPPIPANQPTEWNARRNEQEQSYGWRKVNA